MMTGSGKILGILLIVGGISICMLSLLFIGTGYAAGGLSPTGAVLGLALFGVMPLVLLAGVGAFLLVRSQAEHRQVAHVRRNERLLGLIQSQGRVPLAVLMLEMKMSRAELQNAIYEMVNQGLFTGYIDWDSLTFYSKDAAQIGNNECPNCGGVRELVGRGIVKCPYCGVMLFIPPDAPQTVARPKPPPEPVGTGAPGQ